MFKKRRKLRGVIGFTLTELAAVSAIVSSVPTGAFIHAKNKANETKCINNLQQIGKAVISYYYSEGKYPDARFFPVDGNIEEDQKSIVNIINNSGVHIPDEMWVCPAAPDKLKKLGLTFVYNDNFGGRKSLPRPSKAWLMIEVNCVAGDVPAPHPSGYNILFADGHVITSKKLPKSITDKQRAALQELMYGRVPQLAAAD